MLEFLTTSPAPELLLLLGGIIGVAIAILGNDKKSYVDNIARILGFFVGAVLILMSISMLVDKVGVTSTWLIGLLLGVGLFFKIFKKVPVAILAALILSILVGAYLYGAHMDTVVTLIGAFIVFVVVWVIVRMVEFVADLVGKILGLRPVLFVLGVLGMVEAALLFTGSSISGLF